jgi:hypothetical protein
MPMLQRCYRDLCVGKNSPGFRTCNPHTEAQAFAEDPTKSWEDIEATYLGGQKLQGPSTCLDVPLTAISIVFFHRFFIVFSIFMLFIYLCLSGLIW